MLYDPIYRNVNMLSLPDPDEDAILDAEQQRMVADDRAKARHIADTLSQARREYKDAERLMRQTSRYGKLLYLSLSPLSLSLSIYLSIYLSISLYLSLCDTKLSVCLFVSFSLSVVIRRQAVLLRWSASDELQESDVDEQSRSRAHIPQ
jgi:hypothetical protein